MSDITKEELLAMVDVQSRAAAAMESVANSMRQLSEQNKDIVTSQKSLADGCVQCRQQTCDRLISAVEKKLDDKAIGIEDTRKSICDIKGDTAFIKWVFGGVAIVVGISTVVMQVINWLGHAGQLKGS